MFLTHGVIANTNFVCVCLFSVYMCVGGIYTLELWAFRSRVIFQLFNIRNQVNGMNCILEFSSTDHRAGNQAKSTKNVFEFLG